MEASVKLERSTSPAPDWKSAVEVLIRGARDSASLIRVLLQDHAPGSPTRVLAEKIVGSISRSLLVLDAADKPRVWKTQKVGSPGSDDRRSEIIDGKRKVPPARRVYSSRSHPYKCTRITKNTIGDAYTWRKYGQKPIYNATFPRSYYRCTYKHDRGCQARRQVQQSEEDPTMFVITYMGEHTCRSDLTKSSTSGSYLISFDSNTKEPMQSTSSQLPKLESDEEVVTSASPLDSSPEEVVTSASPLDSSSEEELVLPGDWSIEMSVPTSSLSPPIDFDSLKFDFMGDNECVNLDELLNF